MPSGHNVCLPRLALTFARRSLAGRGHGAPPRANAPFEAFIAPARARPALWRLLAGAPLATAAWLALAAALLPLALRLPAEPGRAFLLAYLPSFAGLVLGTAAAARLLQRRAPSTLLGPGGFRPRHFALAVAVIALLAALSAPSSPGSPRPSGSCRSPPGPPGSPSSSRRSSSRPPPRSLAFRGYLMQGLAARFRSRWIRWLLPPSSSASCTGTRPSSAPTPGSSPSPPPSSASSSPTSPYGPATSPRPSASTSPTTWLAPPGLPPVAARRLQPLARPHRPGRRRRRPPAPPRRPRHHARRLGRLARLPAPRRQLHSQGPGSI